MQTLKLIGIILAVLMVLFMIVGMYYGFLFFWFVLKMIFWSTLIGFAIVKYFQFRNKKD